MALPIAVEKCVASTRWADRCCCSWMRRCRWMQCVYELVVVLVVVCCSSKQEWQVMELGVMQRKVVPSAADFVLDVDETTRFRDEAAASASPATHFHLLFLWPIIY
jgi:hypothetical protein